MGWKFVNRPLPVGSWNLTFSMASSPKGTAPIFAASRSVIFASSAVSFVQNTSPLYPWR